MTANRIALLALAVALACDSSQNDTGPFCTPGMTVVCTGLNVCGGTAICNSAGTGVGPCVCNPLDASQPDASTDAAADGGVWTPKSLPGLCVWLDDTVGITVNGSGNAQLWADQSGLGNNAVAGSQGAPVLKNALHAHDAIQLNQGTLTITDAACLHFGTSPFSIVVIASAQTGGSQVNIWNKDANSTGLTWIKQINSKNQSQEDYFATTHTATVTFPNVAPGAYHVLELDGPTMALIVDQQRADGGVATDDISVVGQWVLVGGGSGELDLAELIAVSQAISPADEANLASYFSTKFGL
jgi:hypothetical protein